MAKQLCLFVCQNYLKEALAIVDSGAFKGISVHSYPDVCYHPQVNKRETLEQIKDLASSEDCQAMVVGGCCLGDSQDLFAEVDGGQLYYLDQCFYLLCSKTLIENYMQQGAYLLSPGWLENWQAHVDRWGFDQPTACTFFQESARQLVLLDTGVDPNSADLLQEFAEFVGLPAQVVPIGLEFFQLTLEKLALEWRLDEAVTMASEALGQANRRVADYSMAFDLLSGLARIMNEQQAVREIAYLFTALFAASKVVYIPMTHDGLGAAHVNQGAPPAAQELDRLLDQLNAGAPYIVTERGFWLHIHYQDEIVGVLGVEGFAFEQYKKQYLNMALEVSRLCGLVIANARAISARQRAEEEVRAALKERESLLYEIHHRVKNNLMVVISLLEMQAGLLDDSRAQLAFKETGDRLYSMALVHEELYAAGDLSRISMDDYLYKLAENLFAAYSPGPRVSLDFQAEALLLGLENATTCGLIANELLTNALRHAFPGGRAGQVRVVLQCEGEFVALTIADDGVGLPEDVTLEGEQSLGLHLVSILIRQLEGKIELSRAGGTSYRITFRS